MRIISAGYLIVLATLLQGCSSWPSNLKDLDVQKALQETATTECAAFYGGNNTTPPKVFVTDGCSLWPDAVWQDCCVAHDMKYWCGGSATARAEADQKLALCVAGAGHPIIGKVMQVGTRLGGAAIAPVPWRWGYGWPWPDSGAQDEDTTTER